MHRTVWSSSKGLLVMMGACLLALMLMSCKDMSPDPPLVTTSDETFKDEVSDAEFYAFQFDGQTIAIDDYYHTVDIARGDELTDGGFYKVVADVTYLNGGVAGYVDYPEVKRVKSCEGVSPFEIGLPTVEEESYGLMLIGDYADGDLLVNAYDMIGVWKDGSWVWRYDDNLTLPDGRVACVCDGVTEDDVQAGIKRGVLSCEDYFVLPRPASAT